MKTQKFFTRTFQTLFFSLLLVLASCETDATVDAIVDEIEEEGQTEEEGETEEESGTTTARVAAKKLYEDYYLGSKSETGDVAWTGDEPSCNAGNVPQEMMDKIFDRLNYFRKAVGLNNTVSENATKSEKAQAAALMMDANNKLDHFPPDSWKCYSADGSEAAGKSLLTTARNAESVDSYMRDAGSNNGPVGHRRWLLWPRLQEIGVGNTAQANAIWVIGNAGSTPADAPEFISWPPKGYSPQQLAYPRWSFSIAGADFSNAQISMKDAAGNSISLQVEDLDPNYGDPTIVWVPDGIMTNSQEDTVYTVNLQDVAVSGEMTSFEYEVVLFDVNR